MHEGSRVLVGVCGSIAAYKAGEVVRELGRDGAAVRVIMTDAATKLVAPATFAALTGRAVHTDLFESPERVLHVELGRWAEAFCVCGATASTLARLAAGSGEGLLASTYLMARCPVVVAPAMHTEMWEHPGVIRNVARLEADGVLFVPPEEGDLASGDHGVGRLARPERIVAAVASALTPKDLAGRRVLITAGPTREPLDPVRFISNRSSGKMGVALAGEAARRGAQVTVVAGPTSVEPPFGCDLVRVETAEEMLRECLARLEEMDVVVKAAAVADWRPAYTAPQKVKKGKRSASLELEQTPDIAAELGRRKGNRLVVLFAAETEREIEYARGKLERKGADLVVANTVGRAGTGFESETNEAWIVDAGGEEQLGRMGKGELATRIWDRVAKMLEGHPTR